MLSAQEFDQLATAIVKASASGINFGPQMEVGPLLEMLSTYTETRPKVTTEYQDKRWTSQWEHRAARYAPDERTAKVISLLFNRSKEMSDAELVEAIKEVFE